MSGHPYLNPDWKSRRLEVNGLNLHIVEAGPRDGLPLLLLHGFPEFWWAWRHHIGPLADAGFRVIVPDLRGYNLSDAPSAVDAYRLDILAADIVALADALSIGQFDLIGHDWGGVVAWRTSAQYGLRIRRLIILDAPHPAVWAGQAYRSISQLIRSSYIAFFQLPWLPEALLSASGFRLLRMILRRSARRGAFDAGAMDHYVQAWRQPGRLHAMLSYYRALRMKQPDSPSCIAAPTLIIWGTEDSFLGPQLAEASLALCDDGRLEFVAEATHWLHLEQPGLLTSLFLDHLRTAN